MLGMFRLFRSRRIVILTLTLTLSILSGLPGQAREGAPGASQKAVVATVRMSVRFADGRTRMFEPVAHREGMTVADLMDALKSKKENDFRYEFKGKGPTAFLLSIDGVANQSGGSDDFWIFRVNGKLASRSFGAIELKPGDEVLWHFGKFQPEPE